MFFSVIVPVYNRERLVGRCIASVLAQEFADYEIVVIDDGSGDGSIAVVREFTDARIYALKHETNRGMWAARNTGIAASRGNWLIFLDSDDELVPGALARMHELAAASPESVHALWFRCRMDDGGISPDPMPATREWDYAGFLGFLDATVGRWRDMMRCVRRDCFQDPGFADIPMIEGQFHLDFARRFRSRAYDDVLRLYHQDADNQLTKFRNRLDSRRDAAFIRDRADGFRALLVAHGGAVAAGFPNLYSEYLQQAAISALVAGRRLEACRYATRLVHLRPWFARAWMLLAASFVGPAAVKVQRYFR